MKERGKAQADFASQTLHYYLIHTNLPSVLTIATPLIAINIQSKSNKFCTLKFIFSAFVFITLKSDLINVSSREHRATKMTSSNEWCRKS